MVAVVCSAGEEAEHPSQHNPIYWLEFTLDTSTSKITSVPGVILPAEAKRLPEVIFFAVLTAKLKLGLVDVVVSVTLHFSFE